MKDTGGGGQGPGEKLQASGEGFASSRQRTSAAVCAYALSSMLSIGRWEQPLPRCCRPGAPLVWVARSARCHGRWMYHRCTGQPPDCLAIQAEGWDPACTCTAAAPRCVRCRAAPPADVGRAPLSDWFLHTLGEGKILKRTPRQLAQLSQERRGGALGRGGHRTLGEVKGRAAQGPGRQAGKQVAVSVWMANSRVRGGASTLEVTAFGWFGGSSGYKASWLQQGAAGRQPARPGIGGGRWKKQWVRAMKGAVSRKQGVCYSGHGAGRGGSGPAIRAAARRRCWC